MTLGKCSLGKILPMKKPNFGLTRVRLGNLRKTSRRHSETSKRRSGAHTNVMLLGKDGPWKIVDLGLVHSSAASSITQLILERLVQAGDVEDRR
jgi:hypothetical protein